MKKLISFYMKTIENISQFTFYLLLPTINMLGGGVFVSVLNPDHNCTSPCKKKFWWFGIVSFLGLRQNDWSKGYPADCMAKVELKITASGFLAWCLNHYTKLVLY